MCDFMYKHKYNICRQTELDVHVDKVNVYNYYFGLTQIQFTCVY